MYSKLALSSLVFGLLASAAPTDPDPIVSQCNTGNAQCCNTVQSATNSPVSSLLGLLGIVLGPITGQIGLGCTPLSIIGIGSGVSCTQQPVCCQGNTFNGLINIGCTPISL